MAKRSTIIFRTCLAFAEATVFSLCFTKISAEAVQEVNTVIGALCETRYEAPAISDLSNYCRSRAVQLMCDM